MDDQRLGLVVRLLKEVVAPAPIDRGAPEYEHMFV
jgi:hypothetical protein